MSGSRRPIGLSLAAILLAAGAIWADPEPTLDPAAGPGALIGTVTSSHSPLRSAWVYAYQIADFSLQKVATSEDGGFRFAELPAGLYKIIAFKSGFVPAVVMLSRGTAQARQYLDLELTPESGDGDPVETGFWAVRERIPPDVLRDIQAQDLEEEYLRSGQLELPDAEVRAEMQAMTGVQEGLDYGDAQVNGGQVDIDGRFRDLEIGLTGSYSELQGDTQVEPATGSTQWFTFKVQNSRDSRVDVSSHNNRLVTFRGGAPSPIDFESHSLSWSQRVGRQGRSDFTAQYTAESNLHRQGVIVPEEIPDASRALHVEGSYTTPISERATLQAGFRYRDLESEYYGAPSAFTLLPEETVELFGRGGVQVKPAVVVEYGLYSKLRDGSLSMIPQGGVIVQLGQGWQASTLASHRIDEQDLPEWRDFSAVFHGEGRACDLGEQSCYEVLLSRLWDDDQNFSVGAIHREFGETLRMYFNRDFFYRLESLFLVQGDRVPELQLGVTRRLTPAVLARFESNIASGGGGIVQTADNAAFENQVSYLVTSLDTQFEQTATGVFLAFHRLEQELNPIEAPLLDYPEVELERLQLSLTQDLGFLRELAWDWAVHVNMELSRGSTPDAPDHDADELRRRVTGGIQVKF